MALAIVQTVITEANDVAATSASYNITAANNCVLLGASNGGSLGNHSFTITGTPAFTERVNISATSGTEGCACAHTHMNSAGHSAVTTTATRAGAPTTGAPGISFTITELSGGETAFGGATASTFAVSGSPSVSITTNQANSYVFGSSSDWAQKGNYAAGTGETLLNTHDVAAEYSGGQWHSTSTQPAAAYTSDAATPPADRRFNIVAIEMREPASTAVPDPGHRRRSLPPHRRRDPREFRAFVQGEGLLEEVTMDKWYAPASEPVPQLLEVVAY